MTTDITKDQNLEKQIRKQMGCMAGFLQIFDRHHFLTGKRFYSPKRLPPSPVMDSPPSESEKSSPPSPANSIDDPPPKSPLPLPIFESNNKSSSSWRFYRESPRLSLDSRATTDAKGSLHPKEIRTNSDGQHQHHHHRSPSVIAKLMGLEPVSHDPSLKQPELRRSASESRVSKDLFQSRFTSSDGVVSSPVKDNVSDPSIHSRSNASKSGVNCWRAPPQRKSFFDSGDFFPEPKQSVTVCGEIERRIKMRGVNETSQDLETLKQILEALQLKGLLHSKQQPPSPSPRQNQVRHRSFVYDESPIVLMKPSRPSNSIPMAVSRPANAGNQFRGGRRNESPPSRSPARSGRSPSPTARSNSSLVKPKPLSVETQRKSVNELSVNRRASPVHSLKLNARKAGHNPTVGNRSPSGKKTTTLVVLEDESSSISGSSITTSTDTERSKAEEYSRDGRSLLERCDKLLHSIAEMAATDAQPSPVSVLDSSFYKDESLTPSPVTTKRIIDFKDQSGELEEEIWSPLISPIRSKHIETSDDSDFVYISDILRATHYLPNDSDVFLLLEKQQYLKGNDTSKVARLHRKLIFDTVTEILDRNKRLPPWKAVSCNNGNITTISLDKVWLEFERNRERESGEDLFETVCGVLKKDLDGDAVSGWSDCPVEMSEAVLDIERLIFKDLIGDSITDLVASSSMVVPRRKLVFGNY